MARPLDNGGITVPSNGRSKTVWLGGALSTSKITRRKSSPLAESGKLAESCSGRMYTYIGTRCIYSTAEERLARINHPVPKATGCNFPMNVSSTDFSSSLARLGSTPLGTGAMPRILFLPHLLGSPATPRLYSFSRAFSRLRPFVFFPI